MGDFCGPFLKGGVHKTEVRIVFSLGIEAPVQEMMYRGLYRSHVDPARKGQVTVQKIPVPVFLGSPAPAPPRPWIVADARTVGETIQTVNPGLICGQGLFRHHISHQNSENIPGKHSRAFTECCQTFRPILGSEVREKIGGLPALLHRHQERVKMFTHEILHAFNHFNMAIH